MIREFVMEGKSFYDPDPALSTEEVKPILAVQEPKFLNAALVDPDGKASADGKKKIYEFAVSMGRKG